MDNFFKEFHIRKHGGPLVVRLHSNKDGDSFDHAEVFFNFSNINNFVFHF